MKKLVAAFLLLVVVTSGCADSTQDVAVTEMIETESTEIIAKDGVTAEVYGAGHPRSVARETLQWTQAEVSGEIDRLRGDGYSLDANGPVFVMVTLPDGRLAEVTWISLIDDSGEEAVVIHVRTDTEEVVQSFRASGQLDEARPASSGGRMGDPNLAFGYNTCLEQARSAFYNCVSVCVNDGGSDRGCRRSCIGSAVFVFMYCLFVSS